jgi:hypothetical protein
MTLNVKLGQDQIDAEAPKPTQASLSIHARKTLDGNIAIFDHHIVDIIISPNNNTIVAFPKEKASNRVYDVQNRLFRFLREKGVITPDSIQGGNIFASLQATYPENEERNSLEAVLLSISYFLEAEKEDFKAYQEFEEEFDRNYTEPDEDDSTELGEIPHHSQKGSIRPGYIYSPYGISSVYRYE